MHTREKKKSRPEGNISAKRARSASRPDVREKEYYELLRRELEAQGGENTEIAIRDVSKNNGITRKACTVRFDGAQVAPTVYLEPYYDHYLHGEAVSESAENILQYCRKQTPDVRFPEDFFREFGSVRGRLGIKLIGRERNLEFLKGVPHVAIEDMAAVFFYLLEDSSFGNGMIIVRNTDLERWGLTADELYEKALDNCPRMLPSVFRPLSDVLGMLYVYPEMEGEGELFLLTNEAALYGASAILYPGALQEAADQIGGDFFVLPSSVHEVILLPDRGEDPEELLRIVREINHTQVTEEEILTDAVYHFVSGDGHIVKLL